MRRAVARGRVFPQKFSTDRRIGRLSLKADTLFPYMWVNADDQGRLSGDPEEIKYAVCPNIDHITKTDIPGLLKELVDNKLILHYQALNTYVVQMLDWWNPPSGQQWLWPSDYPAPEGWQDHLRYKKDAKTVITLNWPVSPEDSGESSGEEGKSIYFILDEDANAVKIGISASPETRLADLQASNPHPLKIIKTLSNSSLSEEQELHKRFAESAINSEWFHYSNEIRRFVSGEDSPEGSAENRPENPLTTPTGKGKGKGDRRWRWRGRGSSPEVSAEERPPLSAPGEKPTSPSPDKYNKNLHEILDSLLVACKYEWGRVPAGAPDEIIPHDPTPRERAQIRDLAAELVRVGGCPLNYIKAAFREAAGQETRSKRSISYVRAILLSWLGVEKERPP